MPLEINQFILEDISGQYNPLDFSMQRNNFLTKYSSGLNIIINHPERTPPPLQDQFAMVDYLFSWLPYYITVYPTEGFYYYSTKHPTEGFIAGNIRMAEIGINHYSAAFFPIKETFNSTYSPDVYIFDGYDIETEQISDTTYKVNYNNKKTVHVHLPFKEALIPPKKLVLLPSEKFIGRIQDESGVKFFLLFNNETNSFYDVLDEEENVPEKLIELNDSIILGARTGFVYYYDNETNRKIFIGAYLPNVQENNFLDGPGDQVPFKISIKEELERAYPNVMLGNGTDERGVYLNRSQWVRIAITPFMEYSYISDVQKKIRGCPKNSNKSTFYTCITKEWWNTQYWRSSIIKKVEEEGKVYPWKTLSDYTENLY